MKRLVLLLLAFPIALMADSTTVINEVLYHPADDSQTEWIELANTCLSTWIWEVGA